jgi:uncharacterized FlaG/YvyC family protein
MNEYQEKHLEQTLKHNKRVKSIRENRLPKSCVDAIDDAIKAMDEIHESIVDGVMYGYHPLSMNDIVKLVEAFNKLRSEFTTREVPKYD